MSRELVANEFGQNSDPVLFSFSVTDEYDSHFEVNILDSQMHTFGDPHAGAIKERSNQAIQTGHMRKHCICLLRLFFGYDSFVPGKAAQAARLGKTI